MKPRILFAAALAAVTGFGPVAATAATDFPNETIRLIVPFKPGGGTDTISRALAAAMEQVAGVAVIVENVPGSNGINGMLALSSADPDGYTIAIIGSSDVSGAVKLREQAPFAIDDFTCAGAVFNTPAWVLSHKDNGLSDLGDFIEAARAKPGEMTIGITGKLGATDFVANIIAKSNDISVNVVNFGGGGPLKKAILANQVNAGVIISPVLLADVKAGELNVLAAAGDLSGINYDPIKGTSHIGDYNADAQIDVAIVRGIFMPAGVSDEVRAKMESILHDTVTGDTFTDFAMNFGFAPYAQSGADYCARLPAEIDSLTHIMDNFMTE
ncbi:MAG: tripartite tricarboxylate transporter substrate binding protein [Marinosulfonomonas sp.]|nr:tripartite tricarboxylate transporter substrate binding protein [Marinosulfonomonas sp.]